MSRVIQKLNYTQRWVNDIYSALMEKGLKVANYPLEKIGTEIRKLHLKGGGGTVTFGMQNGLRSAPIDVLNFEGDLSEANYRLTVSIYCDDSNDPVYNTIHDYYRATQKIGFKYQHSLKPVPITNESEEY